MNDNAYYSEHNLFSLQRNDYVFRLLTKPSQGQIEIKGYINKLNDIGLCDIKIKVLI